MAKNQAIIPEEVPADYVERELTSQGKLWQFGDTNKVFKIHQNDAEGYETIGYSGGFPLVVKNADGIVNILTKYKNLKNGKIITITDTIVNYDPDIHSFHCKANPDFVLPVYERKTGSGEYALVSNGSVMGTNKGDIYKANNTTGKVNVYDEAGSDRYTIGNHTGEDNILTVDIKGNDSYIVDAGAKLLSRDYAGNDQYNFKSTVTKARTFDYAGNDTYTYQSVDNSNIQVSDNKGNDKYTLKSANLAAGSQILDAVGKDAYTVVDSNKVKINDSAGNDKYTFSNVDNAGATPGSYHIVDYLGNDKYTINNASRAIKFHDEAGKDSWTVSKTTNIIINDDRGNDSYSTTETSGTTINESEGKDKYTIIDSTLTTVTDTNGDDKYTVTNGSQTTISDTNGYDSYKFSINKTYVAPTDTKATISITDKAGKDSYTISGLAKTKKADPIYVKNVKIDDKGIYGDKPDFANDKYTLSYIDNSLLNHNNAEFADAAGDDKWTITNSNAIWLSDDGGSDIYTLTNMQNSDVRDAALSTEAFADNAEKNTFNIKNFHGDIIVNSENYNMVENPDELIGNLMSNDTYNLTSHETNIIGIHDFDTGADRYNFNNIKGGTVNVWDCGGSDIYNLKNSVGTVNIHEQIGAGNDLYTITKATGATTVSDWAGDDEYFVSNSKNVVINDVDKNSSEYDDINSNTYFLTNTTDFTINVNQGNDADSVDTYVISSSQGTINDYDSAGDVYIFNKLKNSKVIINDNGGYDLMSLTGAKKNNLVFMANANSDNTLFLYDKASKSYIVMNDYFTKDANGYTAYGLGQINKFEVGSLRNPKEVNVASYQDFNAVKGTVAAFLSEGAGKDYGSIQGVLDSGDKTAINGLIACFNNMNA